MKQAERLQASRSDEWRYRLLIQAVTDYAIYMLDPDGIVSSWNPGAQRFKGYAPDEIIGRHFSCFYGEEDRRAGLPAAALEVAAREGKFEHEGWRIRKDGTRFWAHVVIDPIRGPGGELLGFAKITRDLTERKASEDALRRSEERFRILVQGVRDYSIYMLDPEGRITSWNTGAERIKGYSEKEIIGQHFSRFYTDEDRARGEPQKGLAIAMREGRFEKEGWRIRKDGTRFWASAVIDAIRDEDGAVIGYAKVTRDITERHEAQRLLDQAREALSQSQKMEAIGQLTGGIAHDFNNLLTAVLGSLDLLRKRLPDDPRIMRLLQNAIGGAERGALLTQRMLAFARRQELTLQEVILPDLVDGLADLLRRSLGPSITIVTRFPPLLDVVRSDANQLESALLNLALNARDAMPAGGSLIIEARNEVVAADDGIDLAPGRYVCLSVTDTGVGMDQETLSKAMEPFFTTKGVGKGTGLGLSMIHGMTQQSGGGFILKSRPGEGTVAELWLPTATKQDPAAAGEAVHAAQAVELAPHPLVVLAVDDDSLVLMNTSALLEELGHTALEAASGKEALAIIRRQQNVDLVITDQAMPNMTGMELLGEIRANWPHMPVILATGYAELPPGSDPRISKLAKPFRQGELARAIARAILPA